ncbi:hypothetical protein QR665_09615 [Acinetobacter gerneri]|uniref:hypothetical protein n=1 Tax=Acinetobacter gerneri TaxID=202952 RepID=UPI002936742F|nr:hypothetical protein [Acinetobacter gerneri]MDV2439727.1 hypothetical protein [Acinetobacter gerneri]
MKKIGFVALVISQILLSGCATMMLNEQTFTPRIEKGVLLQDQLIAVGVPAKAIRGYDGALAIAGEQYSYLVVPSTERFSRSIQKPLAIKKILKEVDLNYLTVGKFKQVAKLSEDQVQVALFPEFDILVDDSKKIVSHTIKATEISFMYYKPRSLIKAGEIEHLQSLDFKCEIKETAYRCFNTGYVDITVAKPVSNKNELEHVFKKPIKLNVNYEISKINPKEVASYALTPLAIVFDIVTSPLQLVGYLGFAKAMSP